MRLYTCMAAVALAVERKKEPLADFLFGSFFIFFVNSIARLVLFIISSIATVQVFI